MKRILAASFLAATCTTFASAQPCESRMVKKLKRVEIAFSSGDVSHLSNARGHPTIMLFIVRNRRGCESPL
jgi:hypothetical protein